MSKQIFEQKHFKDLKDFINFIDKQ